MLNAKITISNVNYESCLKSVFPRIMRMAQSMESSRMSVRFLNGMGDDLLPVCLEIMGNMSQEEKNAALISVLEVYNGKIKNMLDLLLNRYELGNAVQIRKICAVSSEGGSGISLIADGVEVDYNALLKTGIVSRYMDLYADKAVEKFGIKGVGFLKGAAKVALSTAFKTVPGEMEKKGVSLFGKPDINDRVKNILKSILERRGLELTVDEISLSQEQMKEEPETENSENRAYLPEAIKASLVDAAVKYLKNSVDYIREPELESATSLQA